MELVPSHMYLAVRKRDDRVAGVIDLRHHINHPILGTWGGHGGYSVCPSERGKGYAKEISEKTILANGGVYEKTIDVDGCKMKRYWITV